MKNCTSYIDEEKERLHIIYNCKIRICRLIVKSEHPEHFIIYNLYSMIYLSGGESSILLTVLNLGYLFFVCFDGKKICIRREEERAREATKYQISIKLRWEAE